MPFDQEELELFLEHHGVKGMHWGVRKESDSSDDSSGKTSNHANLKKAAIIGGTVVGVAAITVGAIYLAKHGGLPLSSISSSQKSAGKKVVDELIKTSSPEKELSGIVHVAGNKYLADRTHRRGGLSDVFGELQKAGAVDAQGNSLMSHGSYKRYGNNLEKVAVMFKDPHDRKDFAGRDIVHQILLPKQHTEGITNFETAKGRAWSLMKDQYEKFWQYGLSKDANDAEARRLGLMD